MERLFSESARILDAVSALPDGITGTLRGRAVHVERVRGGAVDWIVLRTVICAAGDMDPQLVLERNARLAFSAIALAGDEYWLRIALPADSAEIADPPRALALLADAAGSLAPRQTFTHTAAFAHWAA